MAETGRNVLDRLADALAHYDVTDADWEEVRAVVERRDHHGGTIRIPVEVEWRNDDAYRRGYEAAAPPDGLDVQRLARAIHANQCMNDQPPCPVDEYDARRLAALYHEYARLSEGADR